MPPKRKYNKKAVKVYRKYGGKATVLPAVRTLQAVARRAVRQQMNKSIETKQSIVSATDGTEIYHNNCITLDNVVLQTTQGVTDPSGNNNTNNRIGDQIELKGIKFKMMFELNERYSDVTLRVLVIRAAKGDIPLRSTLWKGHSGNKILDTYDTERYTIIHSQYVKLKAPNPGANVSDIGGVLPAGTGTVNNFILSRATKLVKFWVDGSKFKKNRIIQYENGTGQVKFFDYHVVVYAYSNYTTLQDQYYIARLNDYVKVMYYKDA